LLCFCDTFQGPGQYINPLKEGRNANGEVKAILSTQKATPSAKFCGPTPPNPKGNERSMAKPGSDKEPGPGQYVNPMTLGRGADGECKAVLSSEGGFRSTVWFRKGAPRGNLWSGGEVGPGPGAYLDPLKLDRGPAGEVKCVLSTMRGAPAAAMGRPRSACDAVRKPQHIAIARRADMTPGPGQYINPLKEGRNAEGEYKATLSNQQSVRTVKFGGRPASANFRSMAKPGSDKEPGPGQYIDPMKEGRTETGEVKAILSTQAGTPGVRFSGRPYGENSAKARPDSAPSRRRNHGDGTGLFVLDGDEKVLSKYKNVGGQRWGPPGR